MSKSESIPTTTFKRRAKRLGMHVWDFPYIWIVILMLVASAIITYFYPCKWDISGTIAGFALLLTTLLLLTKPMNAVYGLIGASGSIRLYFVNFILISVIFTFIYQFEFFRNAGITYDVNQPHIDYQMFAGTEKNDSIRVSEKKDTIVIERQENNTLIKESVIHTTKESLCYQRINFMQVWRSTILTTLTQEASDLFTIASTHNSSMESNNAILDKEKSDLFEWILIFHIIISWIFFGVFISLLYNKFRYES